MHISAIDSYLPEAILENRELVETFGFDADFLETKLGIRRRHISGPDEHVSDMAVSAAQKVLARNLVDPAHVDLLILCTQNPDYRLPTTANIVQARLGLGTHVAAFDINQGCSGYVYGLSIARSLMQANGFRAGLLITADVYSKIIDRADRGTSPLFGDGATATLLEPNGRGEIGAFTFGSDGSGANELIVRAGGTRHPAEKPVGDMALHMNGRAIYNFMMRRVPQDVEKCLAANNVAAAEIDYFLFHQASAYMLKSLAQQMKLPLERVPVRIEDTGNTVSSTLPLLVQALGGPEALAGRKVLLSGFGVGLSWASTVVRFS